ncbi:MAG: diguanylate cyclase [Maioricimonas sp. JB049]
MSTLQQILQPFRTDAFLLGLLAGAGCAWLLLQLLRHYRLQSVSRLQSVNAAVAGFGPDPVASLVPQLAGERDLALLHARTLDGLLLGLDGNTAAQRLLQNLAPDADRDFAILLGRSERRFWTLAHRGRTEFTPPHTICFDAATEDVILQGQTRQLSGTELKQSGLVRHLFGGQGYAPRKLIISHLPNRDGVELLLVTSTLPGEALPFEVRRDVIVELLGKIAARITIPDALPTESRTLEMTREIFELRSLIDLDIRSNLELIEEFLSRLASLSGFHRASVYVASDDPAMPLSLLCRAGRSYSCEPQCADLEDRLAGYAISRLEMCRFDARQLREFENGECLGPVLTVPLRRQETLVGLLCLSRAAGSPDVDLDIELIKWVAEYTIDIILRTVDHAVIERQARRDALTQLANRHAFQAELKQSFRWADEAKQHCSLVLVDLDHFKAVNDHYGHLAGDEVLRKVAKLLQTNISEWERPRAPMVARYGGEEFAVLLPATGVEEARQIAEHLVDAVRSSCITYDGRSIPVTISAGVATRPDHAQTERQLVAAADAALYRAKQSGRNQASSAEDVTVTSTAAANLETGSPA